MLGFNNKEMRIYLAIVARETVTPSKLSSMTKIPRTTINAILPYLQKRGFIEEVKVKGHWEWKPIDLELIQKKLKQVTTLFEKK